MGQVATVTSKSMITIPSKIRKKYDIEQGSKIEFVEIEEGVLLVPLKTLGELRGSGKVNASTIIEGVKELEAEHREDAKR